LSSHPASPLHFFPPQGHPFIIPAPHHLLPGSSLPPFWSASMVLEPEGNFLYMGGGYNYSLSASTTTRRSAGWIVSLYLGKGGEDQSTDHSVVTSILTTHPIQTMCFHDSDLITGCPSPGLRYYSTSPLGATLPPCVLLCHSLTPFHLAPEEISSAPTSSSSVFSLRSLPSSSPEGESLLVAGGAVPVMDLYAVRGHRAKSLPVVT
jgi:hypothetical protein